MHAYIFAAAQATIAAAALRIPWPAFGYEGDNQELARSSELDVDDGG